MAKLHNHKFLSFNPEVWGVDDSTNTLPSRQVKVGYNRTLELRVFPDGSKALLFGLHGYAVAKLAQLETGYILTLSHYEYRTTTTRQAMGDAISFFGLHGGVSFAKGGFSAIVNKREMTGNDEVLTRYLPYSEYTFPEGGR